jgi:hypothetical protein
MVSSFELGVLVMTAVVVAAIVHRLALRRRAASVAGRIRYEPTIAVPPRAPDTADLWASADPQSAITASNSRQERMVGLVGLVVMVSFGAALLALALYESGSVVARVVWRMLHSAG